MTLLPTFTALSRIDAMRAPAGVGLLGMGAATLLHFHDPHGAGSYGFCPFLTATGRPCPGCGGLRAVNDLTRGDLTGAISSNILAVALIVSVAVAWVVWVVRRLRRRRDDMIALSAKTGIILFVGIIIFGVVRNTPWGSWLAP